jgi:LPS O-antigen subunit length determinant protein (WzzB/FepE family)
MNPNDPNELNIVDLLQAAMSSRKFIILFTSFFTIFAVLYSLSLDNIYSSSYQLSYTSSFSNQENSSLSILTKLASNESQMDSSGKFVIERMRSRDFFKIFHEDDIFLKNLMAYDSFDISKSSDSYISDEYNTQNIKNQWVNGRPSLLNAHKEFIDSNFEIGLDRENGIITLTIFHESPYIAKEWADRVLKEINLYISNIDKTKAQNAYNFLINKLQESTTVEIRKSISALMEKELNTLMLSEVLDNYVFDIIEHAAVPEQKILPQRSIVVLTYFIASFSFSLIVVLALFFMDKKMLITFFPPKIKSIKY